MQMIGKIWNFYVKKMQKFVMMLFGVLWLVFFLTGCTPKEEESMMLLSLEEVEAESDAAVTEPDPANEEPAAPELLYVHVCGAVQNPGVYELPSGSRVYEAVESAGGFAENADEDYVNQAQVVQDGAKIVIPTIPEVAALLSGEQTKVSYGILQEDSVNSRGNNVAAEINTDSGLLNLNTATRSELCALPGIGETKADAIIAYRTKIGVFTSKEQVMEIEGIKDGLYSKIKDKICVE